MAYQKDIVKVSEIGNEFTFVSDSQDLDEIYGYFKDAKDYRGFFILKSDLELGKITFVYAISQNIPYVWYYAHLLRPK